MRIEIDVQDEDGVDFTISLSHNARMSMRRSTNVLLDAIRDLVADPTFVRLRTP